MFLKSVCLLSEVDILMSQVNVLMSEINTKLSRCPVNSYKLLPRVARLLSEMEFVVSLSQNTVPELSDNDDYDNISLDWDSYNNPNYYDLHIYDSYNHNMSSSTAHHVEEDYHDGVEEDYQHDVEEDHHDDVEEDLHDISEDVLHDNAEDERYDKIEDGGDGVDMISDYLEGGESDEYSIADRVLARRRSTPEPDQSCCQDQPSSSTSAPQPQHPPQADLIINNVLTCISRTAPNDIFSVRRSRRMRMKKTMKKIQPELRSIFRHISDLQISLPQFLQCPGASVPYVRPPVPLVDWAKVNERFLGNLPHCTKSH